MFLVFFPPGALQISSAEPKPEVRVRRRRDAELSSEDVWLQKADVCLSMGLYPPARQLLTQAHLLAKVGSQSHVSRRGTHYSASWTGPHPPGDEGQSMRLLAHKAI